MTSCMQHEDFKSMPSQVLCLAASTKFTQQAENAVESGQLSSLQVRHLAPHVWPRFWVLSAIAKEQPLLYALTKA